LCYFSMKENQKLLYLDRNKMLKATIETLDEAKTKSYAKQFVFQIGFGTSGQNELVMFGAESVADLTRWTEAMDQAVHDELYAPTTMQTGEALVEDLRMFKLYVNNRRKAIEAEQKGEGFEPVFKDKLWKLKSEGDAKSPEHWFLRDMWIGENGSLCYYSEKEKRNLVHYNAQDIAMMSIYKVVSTKTAMPYAFEILRAPVDRLQFEPGLFAADGEEDRDNWIAQFEIAQAKHCLF